MATRPTDGRDPALAEVLQRNEEHWVPLFLARAALGLTSVVWATAEGVALLAPVEASALLKARGDAKGAARVAGTPTPGSAWTVGVGAAGHSVWAMAMTPIFTRGG